MAQRGLITRKHSGRVRTARLETVHASVSLATTGCWRGGGVGRVPK